MTNAHTDLVNRCLVRMSGRGILCWSNKTGAGFTIAGNFIRFGKKGSGDIIGCSPLGGRFIGVECKTGNATQEKKQGTFQRAVEMRGGIYVLARCPEDTDAVPGWDEARAAA